MKFSLFLSASAAVLLAAAAPDEPVSPLRSSFRSTNPSTNRPPLVTLGAAQGSYEERWRRSAGTRWGAAQPEQGSRHRRRLRAAQQGPSRRVHQALPAGVQRALRRCVSSTTRSHVV